MAAHSRSHIQMRVRNSSRMNTLHNSGVHFMSADDVNRRQSMRRLILKQGYLKKLPNAAKLGSRLKKAVRRWFVFGVMSGSNPYLEYYENEDSVFTDHPINIIFLNSCCNITQANRHARHDSIFTVVLHDRNLCLIAQTRSTMLEWARILTEKLLQLDILETDGPNDYVIPPMARPSRHSIHLGVPSPGHHHSHQRSSSVPRASEEETSQELLRTQIERYLDCGGTVDADMPQSNGDTSAVTNGHNTGMNDVTATDDATIHQNRPPRSPEFNGTDLFRTTGAATNGHDTHMNGVVATRSATAAPRHTRSPPPPEVNETNPFSPEALTASGANAATPSMLAKMQELNGADIVFAWNAPPVADERAPPPYMAPGVLLREAPVSLKHSQVNQLKAEIAFDGGMTLTLSKLDCHQTVAFVDCFRAVWIAGWNQKVRPHLYQSLHVGDQVMSVNGQVVENAKIATKLIKSCTDMDNINIMIRRMPHAKVFCFRRAVNGESLGISRVNGTAEIGSVSPEGLAAQQGLPAKAQTLNKDNFCNWWITEVNHRPVNLYFKRDEIEHRLKAVGHDISIVVQPIEFIDQLKHQLKKFKNYKDFAVQ